jgi:hypothetical protein
MVDLIDVKTNVFIVSGDEQREIQEGSIKIPQRKESISFYTRRNQ